MTLPAKQISISIQRPAEVVYEFASKPENAPRWAAGLAGSIRKDGDEWIADSPAGKVRVWFTPRNDFGILDHTVTLPGGQKVEVPMRVVSNDEGSEVIFTLFRQPGMSDADFARDAGMVERDLKTLKELMEN